MKQIEDLRNTCKDRIWILGSGYSLNDYPKDFFNDKIFISLNWIFFAFPPLSNNSYILTTHIEPPKYLMEKKPEFLKKCILGLPLASRKERWNADSLGRYKNDPIYFRWHWIQGNEKLFLKYLKPTVQSIVKEKLCKYICLKTNVHYAIQMAVIFGAKRIALAGCDKEPPEGKSHATRNGLLEIYGKKAERNLYHNKWQLGMKLLAQSFKPYGIEINRHYYKSGYEAII